MEKGSTMKTVYQGKEYRFKGFEELWSFYQKILSHNKVGHI
jgi:hypothetical protein